MISSKFLSITRLATKGRTLYKCNGLSRISSGLNSLSCLSAQNRWILSSASLNQFRLEMVGIPFDATEDDIKQFFSPIALSDVKMDPDMHGRPTGRAYVDFSARDQMEQGLLKHMNFIRNRFIRLRRVDASAPQGESTPSAPQRSTSMLPPREAPRYSQPQPSAHPSYGMASTQDEGAGRGDGSSPNRPYYGEQQARFTQPQYLSQYPQPQQQQFRQQPFPQSQPSSSPPPFQQNLYGSPQPPRQSPPPQVGPPQGQMGKMGGFQQFPPQRGPYGLQQPPSFGGQVGFGFRQQPPFNQQQFQDQQQTGGFDRQGPRLTVSQMYQIFNPAFADSVTRGDYRQWLNLFRRRNPIVPHPNAKTRFSVQVRGSPTRVNDEIVREFFEPLEPVFIDYVWSIRGHVSRINVDFESMNDMMLASWRNESVMRGDRLAQSRIVLVSPIFKTALRDVVCLADVPDTMRRADIMEMFAPLKPTEIFFYPEHPRNRVDVGFATPEECQAGEKNGRHEFRGVSIFARYLSSEQLNRTERTRQENLQQQGFVFGGERPEVFNTQRRRPSFRDIVDESVSTSSSSSSDEEVDVSVDDLGSDKEDFEDELKPDDAKSADGADEVKKVDEIIGSDQSDTVKSSS